MKIFLKRFIVYIIKTFSFGERLASLNKLVNSDLNNHRVMDKVSGYFIDSLGGKHKLIEWLRDKIKPGLERNLKRKIMKIFHQVRIF